MPEAKAAEGCERFRTRTEKRGAVHFGAHGKIF